jgi:hypothetical protein
VPVIGKRMHRDVALHEKYATCSIGMYFGVWIEWEKPPFLDQVTPVFVLEFTLSTLYDIVE